MRIIRDSLLVSGFLVCALSVVLAADKGDSPSKKPKGKITIGKETTYATGPLDKDGYIDYAAALNERLGKGVTPANNANVLIWKALGPRPEGGRGMPAEFFKLMGIQEPPAKGDYLIEFFRYRKEVLKIEMRQVGEDIFDRHGRVTQAPWTPKDHPDFASWLKANEKPLAVLREATRRTHYFSPLVPSTTGNGSAGLVTALLPAVQRCREAAHAFTARAMLRAGEGKYEAAWQDLLSCHRLGRLVGRGATLIEGLVGLAIESIAAQADVVFLASARLDAKQIEKCLSDLRKLPPLPGMADKVDLCERFTFLEAITLLDRHGLKYARVLAGLGGVGLPDVPEPILEAALKDVDWDVGLKNANRWYNRLSAAMRGKDRASREQALNQMDSELKALKKKIGQSDLAQLVKADKKARGKAIGDVLIALLIPAVQKVATAGDRVGQIDTNLHLAFALAWHRADKGSYPKKLDDLAPKYLKEIPLDVFSGRALIYRPSKNGYLLYSVGVNGIDEQGRSYGDMPPGDDLSVRMRPRDK
jgi:hypothetical protein